MNRPLLAFAAAALAAPAMADVVTIYDNHFDSRQQIGSEWITRPEWQSVSNFGSFLGRFGQETHTLLLGAYHPDSGGGNGGNGGDGDGSGGSGGSGGGGSGGGDGGGSGGGSGGGGSGGGGSDGGGNGGGGTNPGGTGGNGGGPSGSRASVNYTLMFDLYLIDSWDGGFPGAYGPDYFGVAANGTSLLQSAMHSTRVEQNFQMPTVGPAHLGYDARYKDSIYRDVTLEFSLAADADSIRINFIGAPSSSNINDESWGIDNVRVYARQVPAPGGAGALLLGLASAGRRRRHAA